jgi:hypothetical protein
MNVSKTKASVVLGLMLLMLIIGTYSIISFAQTPSQDCEYFFKGKLAISACDSAIKKNPKDALAFNSRGLAKLYEGDCPSSEHLAQIGA